MTDIQAAGSDAGTQAEGAGFETPDVPAAMHGGNADHPAAHSSGLFGLALGALGVVFGDIGTSPLYAVQTVFSIDDGAVKPTVADVYGVVSLIFWSITLVVSVKYVSFILRADNDGEGGIMALAALVRAVAGGTARRAAFALALGVLGASLFYGDSLITPAISVLSAVEGLEVAAPELADAVLPIGIVILAVLFAVQRFGTHRVGRLFGPVMVVWFVVLAVLGVPHIVEHPAVLLGLSPTYRGVVRRRPPVHGVHRDGRGRPGDHRRRGAVRGHGPLRAAPDPGVLVRGGVPGADPQLPGPGGADRATTRRRSATRSTCWRPAWARLPLVVLATVATSSRRRR